MSPQSPQPTPKQSPRRPARPTVATAESFLACMKGAAPIKECQLPDGTVVYLHGLTDCEYARWREGCDRNNKGQNVDVYANPKMLVLMIRDEHGNRLFPHEADVFKLAACYEKLVQPLLGDAMELNGMTEQAEEALRKNSPTTPNSDSGSG